MYTPWVEATGLVMAGLPGVIAAFYSAKAKKIAENVKQEIQTPSGDPLGQVTERGHDLSASASMASVEGLTKTVETLDEVKKLNGNNH